MRARTAGCVLLLTAGLLMPLSIADVHAQQASRSQSARGLQPGAPPPAPTPAPQPGSAPPASAPDLQPGSAPPASTPDLQPGAPPPACLVDESDQEILRRAPVPRGRAAVGEVRLLRRGDAVVVETVISTFLFGHVVAEIRAKEARNWPPGRSGAKDSLRYVAELERFARDAEEAAEAAEEGADSSRTGRSQTERLGRPQARRHRRVQMAIEFVRSPGSAWVLLSALELDGAQPGGRVLSKLTRSALALSPDYVQRNMALIAADAFGIGLDQVAELMAAPRRNDDGPVGSREPPVE